MRKRFVVSRLDECEQTTIHILLIDDDKILLSLSISDDSVSLANDPDDIESRVIMETGQELQFDVIDLNGVFDLSKIVPLYTLSIPNRSRKPCLFQIFTLAGQIHVLNASSVQGKDMIISSLSSLKSSHEQDTGTLLEENYKDALSLLYSCKSTIKELEQSAEVYERERRDKEAQIESLVSDFYSLVERNKVSQQFLIFR
jgi:hypothetical protein